MYSKGSNDYRNLTVPENYGGNAFRKGVYTDLPPQRPSQTSGSSVYSSNRLQTRASTESTSRQVVGQRTGN